MKIALSAAAVLAIAGAASAAPFSVSGATLANDGTSFTGITTSSGVFHRSTPLGSTGFLGGRLVAPADQGTWEYYRAGLTTNPTTFLGALGGEAPTNWDTVANTPGGDVTPGFAQFGNAQNTLNNGGWFRAGLGPVSSAQATINGFTGEYVWLAQLVVAADAEVGGDFTLLTLGSDPNGGINRTEINTGVPNAMGLFAFTVTVGQDSAGRSIQYLYVSDVPAPGAFALLGLAGLAGARRRR